MDRRIDLAVAVAFAVLGLVIVWQAAGIRPGMMRDPVGPRAAFFLCGGLLAAGGLWVALKQARALARGEGRTAPEEGVGDEAGYPARAGRAFALFGGLVLYALLLQPLGYLIATPLFVAGGLVILGQRNAAGIAVTAATFTLVNYVVFAQALGVRLPVGPLTGLFRQLGWVTL